jgi:hypothetical protein
MTASSHFQQPFFILFAMRYHMFSKFTVYLFCCMLGITSGVDAAPESFRGTDDWCGNPDVVQTPDNPYVKLAHTNVTRARTTRPNAFWLVWGATAPESNFRNDAKLREEALTAYQAAVDKSVEKKETFWSLLDNLESLHLWQRSKNPPTEKIEQWLAALKPCVEANFAANAAQDSWTAAAPNTLHQSAAILQLGSLLYQESKYADMARQLVQTAAVMQEADGAFRYIRQSGPSQVYYGFDATFLGRYYQLSRDPLAKEQLIKMASYSKDALANGLMEGASAPWWKHLWGSGGPIHGVEIAAGLARDPLTRTLAQYRLEHGAQPYMFSYYAMYFYDATIPSDAKLGADILRYNTNIGGPQLRVGPWQVVMPGKAYADTNIGISVATGQEPMHFDGYLSVAALPVLQGGATDAHARPKSLITAGTDALPARRCVVGDKWIASAWAFNPCQPFFANLPEPKPGNWQLAQLWFADEQGVAGWISVTAMADSGQAQPRGYLDMGDDVQIDSASPTQWTSGTLHMQVLGSQVQSLTPIEVKGKTNDLWVNLADADQAIHKAGDTYGYGLTAAMIDKPLYNVKSLDLGQGVLGIHIQRPGQSDVKLVYNASDKAQTITLGKATCWRSTSPLGGSQTPAANTTMSIAPGELVVMP